jgi:hypothetical protein
LTLREQGDQLQVQWGKATDTIQQVTGGVLEIHDGNEVKQAKLTPEDVRNGGTLAFTPRSDDVSLRLRIDGQNGQTTSQSFRFLPTMKGPQPTQELPRTGTTVVNVRTPSMVRIKPAARKTFHPPVLLAMAPRTTDIEGPPALDFNLLVARSREPAVATGCSSAGARCAGPREAEASASRVFAAKSVGQGSARSRDALRGRAEWGNG